MTDDQRLALVIAELDRQERVAMRCPPAVLDSVSAALERAESFGRLAVISAVRSAIGIAQRKVRR